MNSRFLGGLCAIAAFGLDQARCPDHEQTEQDHDRAADEVEFVAPLQQRLTERGGRGPKRDEYRGEAKDETEAEPDGPPLRRRCTAGDRTSGNVGYVAGHERQHAGRQKGNGTGQQCRH